jgi:hypothetical protein
MRKTVFLKRGALTAAVLVLALANFPWVSDGTRPVHAQETDDCPEGEGWLECKAAAGDPLAQYRLGRTAYDEARQTGDFSEALRIGRDLVAQDDRNGKRLLKMVHLQLSWGHHKDYVQAYVWMVEDKKAGLDYLDKLIGNLGDRMTPEQLAAAKKMTGS